jgi:hypothetical protein
MCAYVHILVILLAPALLRQRADGNIGQHWMKNKPMGLVPREEVDRDSLGKHPLL